MLRHLRKRIIRSIAAISAIMLLPVAGLAVTQPVETKSDETCTSICFSNPNGYIFEGVGAELDPHLLRNINTEQGCTEADWNMVCQRVEAMHLQKIRVMVMPEWYEPQNENDDPFYTDMSAFSWNNEDMNALYKVLDLAQRENIQVNLTLWGAHATKNSWLAVPGCVHWVSPPNDLDEWSENICALLKHLIEEKGYSCVKEITPYNEPDPAYYVTNTSEVNIEDYAQMVSNLHERLTAEGLRAYVSLNLGDDGGVPSWLEKNVQHTQLSQIGDCFNSHIYMKQDATLSEISATAQSYLQTMSTNTDKAFKINEFGAKYAFSDNVNCQELDSYQRGMLTAKMLTVFLGEGCSCMVQWCLFDQYYGNDAMMYRGLWKYKDEDWKIRPVYYPLATVTQHTSVNSSVYKGITEDTSIAGTALQSSEGWTYLLVNESTIAKTVAITNTNCQAGSFAAYRYFEEMTIDDNALALEAEEYLQTKNGALYCTLPANSFTVLTQMESVPVKTTDDELLDVSGKYWISTDLHSDNGLQENDVLKLSNSFATFVGTKAGEQKISVTFSGKMSQEHWAAIQFRGNLTPEQALSGSKAVFYSSENDALAIVIKNGGKTLSLNAQNTEAPGTPCRLAGDVTELQLGDGKEHTIEILSQELSDGTVEIKINVDGEYQQGLYCKVPAKYGHSGYVTVGYQSAESNLFIRSVKIEEIKKQHFQTDPAAAIYSQGEEYARYDTVQAAVDLCKSNCYVKMIADSDENIWLASDLYMDLNGHILYAMHISAGVLYGMDSKTDDYSCADGYGKIINFTVDGTGQCANACYTADRTEKAKSYVMLKDGQGVSFHRYYMAIISKVLRPSKAGVGFKAIFAGDEKIQESMDCFGIEISRKADFETMGECATFTGFQSGFGDGTPNMKTVVITNILSQWEPTGKLVSIQKNNINANTVYYGRPYMVLNENKIYTSVQPIPVCLRDMVNAASELAEGAQLAELMAMYASFRSVMDTEGWNVKRLK